MSGSHRAIAAIVTAASGACFLVGALLSGCVASSGSSGRRPTDEPYAHRSARRVESWEADRLRRVMIPLIRAMDRPCRLSEVRITFMSESDINAANGGGCEFYLTLGLLRRASEDQLRGVMAHEIAHQDLGHVAKAQVLGAGLDIGAALLEQLVPGSQAITPLVGTLIARGYGRSEEYVADRHAVELLVRAGYPKEIMVDTLSWIRRVSGENGGGFLSTHPAMDDRIAALRRMR